MLKIVTTSFSCLLVLGSVSLSSLIPMSLTLHTTEIWLNTDTDSGGMKDRTHGIVSQRVSEIRDTQKNA